MGVPCPGCGREYDVALFQFGRTFHCTCGRRVALEPRVRSVTGDAEPRFAVDAMLGRLARWLRFMGYDSTFDAAIEDEALVRQALDEDRVLLTRDRALPGEWSVPRVLVLESEALRDQLVEVTRELGLDWRARLFTRCSRCNTPLRELPGAEVAERLPPRVLREQERFASCPTCNRVYWAGSHSDRMRRVLEETLGVLEETLGKGGERP
jgi:uncharacterized protein with PIN domain